MLLDYCFCCSHIAARALFPLLISISSMICIYATHTDRSTPNLCLLFFFVFSISFDINKVVRVRNSHCLLRTCANLVYQTNEAMSAFRQRARDRRRANEIEQQNTYSLELKVVVSNDFDAVIRLLPTCKTRINVFDNFIGKYVMTRQRKRYHWSEKKNCTMNLANRTKFFLKFWFV